MLWTHFYETYHSYVSYNSSTIFDLNDFKFLKIAESCLQNVEKVNKSR